MLIEKMNQGMQPTKETWVYLYPILQSIQCWSQEPIWEAHGGTRFSAFSNFIIPSTPLNEEV